MKRIQIINLLLLYLIFSPGLIFTQSEPVLLDSVLVRSLVEKEFPVRVYDRHQPIIVRNLVGY